MRVSYDEFTSKEEAISASVDYRYGSGKDYNGPVLFGKNILANLDKLGQQVLIF